jgi:hypothetical protein
MRIFFAKPVPPEDKKFMKNATWLLTLTLFVVCFSCKKKEDSPVDPNAGVNARFTVTGVKDVDLSQSSNGRIVMPISITTKSGSQPDTVSIQVTDLPQGISVGITPVNAKTSFTSRIEFINKLNGAGGSYPIKVLAIGNSGTLTYPMILTVPGYIGWTFNDTGYSKSTVVKDAGLTTGYPYIYVNAYDGSRLVIHFPYKATLPKTGTTYKIGSATAEGTIQLQFFRDSTQIFVSTAAGAPTGIFSFDTLGKFIFKCDNVQMSNGFYTGKLKASFPE